MKRALLIALGMFLTVGVLAQGNVLFQSKNANPAVNFKILNPDGTVAAANMYTVGLWGGATADSLAPLKAGGVDDHDAADARQWLLRWWIQVG